MAHRNDYTMGYSTENIFVLSVAVDKAKLYYLSSSRCTILLSTDHSRTWFLVSLNTIRTHSQTTKQSTDWIGRGETQSEQTAPVQNSTSTLSVIDIIRTLKDAWTSHIHNLSEDVTIQLAKLKLWIPNQSPMISLNGWRILIAWGVWVGVSQLEQFLWYFQ